MFQTESEDDIPASESSDELNSQLRRENKELRGQVERLRILLSDVSETLAEKPTMLEAFDRSCAREEELRRHLEEEKTENDCLEDTLMDMRYIKMRHEARQAEIQNLKHAVLRAKFLTDEVQYALAERDEIIQRRHAEIVELFDLYEDCTAHLEVTRVRVQDAEEAVRKAECLPKRESVPCIVKREESVVHMVHNEVRSSRVKDMLIALYSFAFTMLFLFFFISSVIPAFSSEEILDTVVTKLIPDSLKELIVPFTTVIHTNLPPC